VRSIPDPAPLGLERLATNNEIAGFSATRAALTNYLELVIASDWPQMALEKEGREVTRSLDNLYAATLSLAPSASRPQAVLVAIFNQLDAITQARRARLHLAHGIVPTNLWVVLVLRGMLTVGFTFFLGTRNLQAQIAMTGILTLIVFMGLFVIVSIDHPFTGPVHISADPLRTVIEDFSQPGS
jgi:hypothetical protein